MCSCFFFSFYVLLARALALRRRPVTVFAFLNWLKYLHYSVSQELISSYNIKDCQQISKAKRSRSSLLVTPQWLGAVTTQERKHATHNWIRFHRYRRISRLGQIWWREMKMKNFKSLSRSLCARPSYLRTYIKWHHEKRPPPKFRPKFAHELFWKMH